MEKKPRVEVFPDKDVYKATDFFVLRTPLLPVDYYYSISAELNSQSSIEKLIKSHPKIEGALTVGNSSFMEAIKKLMHENPAADGGKKGGKEKDSEKVLSKLQRVLTRMSTRSTPFGVYAGVSLGKWTDSSNFELKETGTKTRTRLDSEVIARAAFGFEKELLPKLQLVANPTLRQFFGRLYLLEKAPTLDEKDVDGSWLEATEEVMEIVAMAQSPISYGKLLLEITEKFNMYEEDTQALIEYLVENTYLLSSLRPNTFDTSGGDRLVEELAAASQEPVAINEVLADLKALNEKGEIDSKTYLEINQKAKEIFKLDIQTNLQTDMYLSLGKNGLKKSISADAVKLMDLMMRISAVNARSSSLRQYKEKFMTKYEGRAVPILEVLNQDFGLGFPTYASSWSYDMEEYSRQYYLDELIHEAVRDRKIEVQISDDVLAKLLAKSADFKYPASVDMFMYLLSPSAKDVDEGNYRILPTGLLAGAGRSLGRFADMLGDEAINALRSVDRAEQALLPDQISAEISSLPRSLRLGNVCTIPGTRQHRIVLDSWPGNETEIETIHLNDLLIGLNEDQFYLRSAKTGAIVRAYSPSLLNSLFRTQIARFLTAVSDDAINFAGTLRWGSAADASFRPRVRYEKFILSSAMWTIRMDVSRREEFASAAKFNSWLKQWRERWFVPRYVQLKEADNVLLIDLDNEYQVDEFRKEICNPKHTTIQLQESFCEPDHLWLEGPGGKYVSEIVASAVLANKAAETDVAEKFSHADPNLIPELERVRCPGNEWIYFKLYSGKSLQDDLIVANIMDFVSELKSEKLIDSWFFIRYEDPEPHLRVRLFGKADLLELAVTKRVMAFCNGLVNEGLCTRFVHDTYNREIERYGGLKAISIAEDLFNADSEFVANLLNLETQEGWSIDKQLIASCTLDRLVDAMGLDTKERSKWYKTNANRNLYGDEFRKDKDQLHFLFSNVYGSSSIGEDQPLIQALFAHLNEWATRLEYIGKKYKKLQEDNEFYGSYSELLSSLVHMHCNRYLGVDRNAEIKARTLACRAHEARANRKELAESAKAN